MKGYYQLVWNLLLSVGTRSAGLERGATEAWQLADRFELDEDLLLKGFGAVRANPRRQSWHGTPYPDVTRDESHGDRKGWRREHTALRTQSANHLCACYPTRTLARLGDLVS